MPKKKKNDGMKYVNRMRRLLGLHPVVGKLAKVKGGKAPRHRGAYSFHECLYWAGYCTSKRAFRTSYPNVYAAASSNRWLPIINGCLGWEEVKLSDVEKLIQSVRIIGDNGEVWEGKVPYSVNL
jgi:hypothetical protein